MAHINRYLETWLEEFLPHLPAVMIDGAKGVGKTQTAKRFAKTVKRLDDQSEQVALAANFNRIMTEEPPILLDEWQFLPEVWNRVRQMIDDHTLPGSVILTGSIQSKSPMLHSGAGRIVRIRMRPLSLAERVQAKNSFSLEDCLEGNISEIIDAVSPLGYEDYVREILRSGFPEINQMRSKQRELQLDSYLENIIHREFALQGVTVRHPGKLFSWMQAYASATATSTSYNKMLDATTAGESDKPAKETVIAYREALRSLWLIDDLPFWSDVGSPLGRLKETPKHYLADPALEARLLQLSERDLITGTAKSPHDADYGGITGRLFESLCVMSARTYAANLGARVGYVRTSKGEREVDLVIQKNQKIVAIEVKLAQVITDHDVRHLNWFEEKVGERVQEKIILTTGDRAYRRPQDRVLVIPAALFA